MDSKYNIGHFGDKRLEEAGKYLTQSMIGEQKVSMRKLGRNSAGTKKIYRFFSNERVTLEELAHSISDKIRASVEGRHVLVIQDTTELNYQHHVGRTRDLGPVGNGTDIGFFLHPALVVNAVDSTCLGLSSVMSWQRTGESREHYKRLPIEEKESYRWIKTALMSKERLSKASMITVIADRESDIYEEWHRVPDDTTHMLNRICRNRSTTQGKLYEELDNFDIAGSFEIEVKTRKDGKKRTTRSEHKACLNIRYGDVEILKPGNCTDKEAPSSIRLRAIDVREAEETVVEGESPIHWRLMTTHSIPDFEAAKHIVQWYCERWNIEQLFRTLKRQGLNVESSQMETSEKLQKLSMVGVYVATLIMQMVMARDGKDQDISVVFGEDEQKVLKALVKTVEGKTTKLKNPYPPDCLSWATWIIARLGGWLGYTSDGKAGPITMRHGLKKFESMLEGYYLAKDVSTD